MKRLLGIVALLTFSGCVMAAPATVYYSERTVDPHQWHTVSVEVVDEPAYAPAGASSGTTVEYVSQPVYVTTPVYVTEPYYYSSPVSVELAVGVGYWGGRRGWGGHGGWGGRGGWSGRGVHGHR